MRIHPRNDWFVVKAFPHEDMSSIVHGTVENKTVIRTGRVIAAGAGRWRAKEASRIPHRYKVGDKVAFLRWHKDHQTGKASNRVMAEWSMEVGADLFILHLGDVLLVARDEDEASAKLDVFPAKVDTV